MSSILLPFPTTTQLFIATAAALFALTGCSDHPPRSAARAEQLSIADEKPAMSAQGSFFDDKLLVEANLGRGFRGRGGPGGASGRMGEGHPGGRHHGGMGPGANDGGPGGVAGPSLRDASMPPVALRLRLTNTSQETVEVTFVLCKSELGDFAVRPEKMALAPGQTAEPEAMTSRLGLTTSELVLKVGLRMSGKAEQKELVLKAGAPSLEVEPQR